MPREPWGAGPGPINRASRRMDENGSPGGCGWVVMIVLALVVYAFVGAFVDAL